MFLSTFLVDIPEDVIENKVSGGLFGKDEGLAEFLELGRLVGGFTDNLDNDVIEGSLGVDVGDTDFAVLKVEFADTFLDSLLTLDKIFCHAGCEQLTARPTETGATSASRPETNWECLP